MPEELVTLTKTKGFQVIHLSQPTRIVVNDVDNINWSIDSTSLTKLSTLDFSLSNVAIVTTYEDLKYDKMLAFIGNFQGPTPNDNDYILLGLFLATMTNLNDEDVNVQDFLKVCDSTKYNINVSQSSGCARREYHIKDNLSSVGSFASKPKKILRIFFWRNTLLRKCQGQLLLYLILWSIAYMI